MCMVSVHGHAHAGAMPTLASLAGQASSNNSHHEHSQQQCRSKGLRARCAASSASAILVPVSLRAARKHSGRTVAAHAAGGAAPPAPMIDWDVVYAGGSLPPVFIGPVEVREAPGKGRGLFATRDLAPGELVLVCAPLLYAASEGEGDIPSTEEMAARLETEALGATARAWLAGLHAGDEYASPKPLPPLGAPLAAGGDAATLTEEEVAREARFAVCALNVYGEEAQDLAASAARGEGASGHLGLWPEFALLNHSCAPNAANWTVGDRMVVRAAAPIPKGGEVLINYLGRGALKPCSERLLDLRDGYGFACGCARCNAEMDGAHDAAVFAVQGVYEAVMNELLPGLQAALGGEGGGMVAADDKRVRTLINTARGQLAPLLQSMDATVAAAAGGAPASAPAEAAPSAGTLRAWLRGSGFEGYSLQAQLEGVEAQLSGATAPTPAAASAQAAMLATARDLSPASDLHLFLALRAAASAAGTPDADAADQEVTHVLGTRYGPGLSPATLERLRAAAQEAAARVAV